MTSMAQRKRDLRDCLQKLDPEGDGSISIHLVHKAMQCIGINYSLQALTNELLAKEKDGDGDLEIHEVEGFLDDDEALERAGIQGSLEPWSIGRSLALDALPLAARAFSAHEVVREAMRRSSPERKPERKGSRRPSGAGGAVPAHGGGPASPKGSRDDYSPKSPTPQTRAEGGSGGRSPEKQQDPVARPRSRHFTVWEETKADFLEYSALRKSYEETYGNTRRPRGVEASRRRLLAASASAPTLPRPGTVGGAQQHQQHNLGTQLASLQRGAMDGRLLGARESIREIEMQRRRLRSSGNQAQQSSVRRRAEERRTVGWASSAAADDGHRPRTTATTSTSATAASGSLEPGMLNPGMNPGMMATWEPSEMHATTATSWGTSKHPSRTGSAPRFTLQPMALPTHSLLAGGVGSMGAIGAAGMGAIGATTSTPKPRNATRGHGMRRGPSATALGRPRSVASLQSVADGTPSGAESQLQQQKRGGVIEVRHAPSIGQLASVADQANDGRPKAGLKLSSSHSTLRAVKPLEPVRTTSAAVSAEGRRVAEAQRLLFESEVRAEEAAARAPSSSELLSAKLNETDDEDE
jgi:hypothetical protein